MLTLLSTLISFLMSGTPKFLEFFKDRDDKKHELALARLQIDRELELKRAGLEIQERIEAIHTEQIEMQTTAQTVQAVIGAQQAEMQALEDIMHVMNMTAAKRTRGRKALGYVPIKTFEEARRWIYLDLMKMMTCDKF